MSQHGYMRHTATPPLVLDLIRLSQSASCGKTINFYLLTCHKLVATRENDIFLAATHEPTWDKNRQTDRQSTKKTYKDVLQVDISVHYMMRVQVFQCWIGPNQEPAGILFDRA